MAEGVFKLAINYSQNNVKCTNSLHYHFSDTAILDDPGMDTFLAAIAASLSTPLRALILTTGQLESYTLYETAVTEHPQPPVKTAHYLVNNAGTRADATDHLNRAQCGVMSLQTNRAGRSARGHIFLPPIGNTTALYGASVGLLSTTDPYWTAMAGLRTALLTHLGGHAFWAPLSGYDGKLVVYSQTLRDRAAPNWWFEVRDVVPRSTARWLHSRES